MNGKNSGGRIRRRAHSSSSSNSDEENVPEYSQTARQGKNNSSQRLNPSSKGSIPKAVSAELNEEDKKRLVADAVFYVLVQEQKRAVHKKGDILKVS